MNVILSNYSMVSSGLHLTNSSDVVANSISIIEKDKVVDLKDLFLSKLENASSKYFLSQF